MKNNINPHDCIAYSLYNEKKFSSYIDCYKEFDSLYHMIVNYAKRHKIEGFSLVMGISNTESKTATRFHQNKGKKGRPAVIISGNKINWHIHTYIAIDRDGISTISNQLRMYLQKKRKIGFYQCKNNVYVSFRYVKKQCNRIRMYGDIFKKMNKSLYK